MALPSFKHEQELIASGFMAVAGVDEAGRGPLAGPVVASAVIFDTPAKIKGLKNSKLLSPNLREELFHKISASARSIGIGVVGERVIDGINILQATLLAMREAVLSLSPIPHHILVDGNQRIRSLDIPQTTIIEGDNISASIAAASIVAKVTRDRIMRGLDILVPGYNFSSHKGYGTEEHLGLLRKLGPSVAHRRTFKTGQPNG